MKFRVYKLVHHSLLRISIPLSILFVVAVVSLRLAVSRFTMDVTWRVLNQRTEACSLQIEKELEAPKSVLDALAKSFYQGLPETSRKVVERLELFTNTFTSASAFYGYFAFPSENMYLDGANWVPPAGFNPLARPWYQAAQVAGGGIAFTDVFADARSSTNAYIISLSTMVRDSRGGDLGVVSLNYPLASVERIVSGAKSGGNDLLFVLSSSGHFVAHDTYTGSDTIHDVAGGAFKGIASALLSGSAARLRATINGTAYYFQSRTITGTNWVFVLGEPAEDVNRFTNTMFWILVAIVASIFVLIVVFMLLRIDQIAKPVLLTGIAFEEVASGDADLTKRANVHVTSDEMHNTINGFNKFVQRMQNIMRDIQRQDAELDHAEREMEDRLQETTSSVDDIMTSVNSVSEQVERQSASVDETASVVAEASQNIESLSGMVQTMSASVADAASAIEQMVGNIDSVNNSVDRMSDSFEGLNASAQTGIAKQEAVNTRIEQISTQSDMLQEANTAIANIAEQTNLLAMNAAIEAAHAGEAGKGFSVVADEIRKLSETSSAQSKTIGEQLNKIKESIGEVVTSSKDSTQTFADMSQKIQGTNELVRQIKAAMSEQKEGSRQVTAHLRSMSNSTAEVQASSNEMSSGNRKIQAEMSRLQGSTGSMKESVYGMSQSMDAIAANSASLGGISVRMKDSVQQISTDVNRFTV